MSRLRHRIVLILLILTASMLPGSDVECEYDDGELVLDLGDLDIDFGHGHDCHDGCGDWYFDFWGWGD